MANYLYKTAVYKVDNGNVVGVPASNTADRADFEDNNKSSVIPVTTVLTEELTFEIWVVYSDFSTKVTDWADVKCLETDRYYELYLMSNSPL